jgi:8-oxo-dGTP diphosphatase
MSSEENRYCYKYPRPAVTTDCVVFGQKDVSMYVLLIERGNEPYKGCWAFPGGFLEMQETAEEGALRELEEETHITNIHIIQLGAFTDVDRDPRGRVITIAFYGVVDFPIGAVSAGDDAAKAKWFQIDNLPKLAFDHEKILESALRELKSTEK